MAVEEELTSPTCSTSWPRPTSPSPRPGYPSGARGGVTNPMRALTDTELGPGDPALLGQIAVDPTIGDPFRDTVVRARREEVDRVVRRGVERGDLRPDADVDIATEWLVGPGTSAWCSAASSTRTSPGGRRCLPPWLRRLGRRRGGVPGVDGAVAPHPIRRGRPWVRWLGCPQAAPATGRSTTTARSGTGSPSARVTSSSHALQERHHVDADDLRPPRVPDLRVAGTAARAVTMARRLVTPHDEVLARLDAQRHRRFIKTHTPLDGLPLDRRATFVVVARHPLDTAVSMTTTAATSTARRGGR